MLTDCLPLSARRAMFMSGLSESKQTHVHLRNVDPATLQIIITYAYTGNLAINDSTVEPLYETACFLQVSGNIQILPTSVSCRKSQPHVCQLVALDFRN